MTKHPSRQGILQEVQKRMAFPLNAQIELTRRCNLRCAHCFLDLDGHPGLSTSTYRRILDELAEAGSLFVTFTGGELTLRDDWLELALYARKRDFAVRFITNGTLLSEHQIEAIADLPVLAIHISLYALEEAHEKVTGVRGSFQKTLRTVERLRKAGVKVFFNVPVMETTARDLQGVLDLASSMECGIVADPRICESLDVERDNKPLVPRQTTVTRAVEATFRHSVPIPEKNGGNQQSVIPWPCFEPEMGLYIRADGELWRCPALPISFGSVLEIPVAEAWKSSITRRDLLENQLSRLPNDCRECRYGWACYRCPGYAYLEHGSFEKAATTDCRYAKGRAKGALNFAEVSCDTDWCAERPMEWTDAER